MTTEPNSQASEVENLEKSQTPESDQWSNASDELLKTRIDSEAVVSFIENMVQAMGSAAQEQFPGQIQKPVQRPAASMRKCQSKTVAAIMQKLERVEKYPDLAKQLSEDPILLEWLNRVGCKQKEYFEELDCAQELTSFFGGHRQFDNAVRAAQKAVAITMLHRRDDEETLVELHWVLAELHAATDQMDLSLEYMKKCLALIEPGACEGHPTYNELLSQLEETRQRNLLVVTA